MRKTLRHVLRGVKSGAKKGNCDAKKSRDATFNAKPSVLRIRAKGPRCPCLAHPAQGAELSRKTAR